MKLTEIKQQVRDPERVSLFLDDEFWTGMSKRLLEDLGLAAGIEIDEARRQEIERAVVEDNALDYAFNLLSLRPLTEAKLAEKLASREYSQSVIEQVLKRCRELHLLDDRQWATDVIASRRAAGQGRRLVAQHLRNHGIDNDLAKELLDRAFDPERELSEATAALTARFGNQPLDPGQQRRAYQFLLRRGFSPSATSDAVANTAMDDEQAAEAYGTEQAAEALRRRYGRRGYERDKAFAYLARRGFSVEAIKAALDAEAA